MTTSDADEQRSGLAAAAGRAAMFPARAAAHARAGGSRKRPKMSCPRPRSPASSTGRSPGISRRSSHARSSGIGCSSGSSPSSRPAASWSASTAALASPRTLELTDNVLTSDETQRALRHVASSPELRDAIARHGRPRGGRRRRRPASAPRLDDRAEQIVRRRARPERPIYAGIATRALALATDAAVVTVLFMAATGSLPRGVARRRPSSRLAGRSPDRLGLGADSRHVLRAVLERRRPDAGDAPAATARARPLGRIPLDRPVDRAGGRARSGDRAPVRRLPPVLFTERRRGLPDFLAGTVVLYEDPPT